LAEALLWKAGVIGAMGSTERGTTVCDFDPLEKQYGHSPQLLARQFSLQGHPRPPDRHARHAGFAGQSIAALAGSRPR
jgi:elongation factor G